VDKFGNGVQFRDIRYFLSGNTQLFHVMVGRTLNGFDTRSIFFIEVSDDRIKETDCVGSKSRNFLDRCVRGQFLQPAYFNLYAEFQQTVFAENPRSALTLSP
jgi:hypothetical protein